MDNHEYASFTMSFSQMFKSVYGLYWLYILI